MKKWFAGAMAAILAVMMLCLGGCATIDKVFGSPQGTATAKVVVQVAVFNLLTDHPEYRAPILEITKAVEDYVNGDPSARVDSIMKVVNDHIKWEKLKPNDALAIQATLALVEANLYEKINDKTLPADVKLKVSTIVEWIETVARTGTGIPLPSSSTEYVTRVPTIAMNEGWDLKHSIDPPDGYILA